MEQDKQLKEILRNSAERASVDFTSAVMNRVQGLSAAPAPYQPLVHPKVTKLFFFVFTALVAAIAALSLGMGLLHLRIEQYLQNIALPQLDYNRILLFILLFWVLFTLNALLQKQHRLRKQAV